MKKIFTLCLLLCLMGVVKAQLTVTAGAGVTPATIVAALVGAGVTVSNITENCKPAARGTFTAAGTASTALQMASGIIISNGKAVNAKPDGDGSCCGTSDALGGAGNDPDLQALVPGKQLNDICKIDFDIQINGDTLVLEYVFGTEEHPDYAPPADNSGSYNDVFGFFLSGPGIAGSVNIAKVPGTTADVSVKTINTVTNSSYFVENYNTKSCSGSLVTCSGSNTSPLEFNGYTKKMSARVKVSYGGTYHMKMAICDVTDGALNTAAFINSGSIKTVTPVGLISFKGSPSNKIVFLNWVTASEQNNDRFEIDRSKDGHNFETIGRVKGAGNTGDIHKYAFEDVKPLDGIAYYRLRLVDIDGKAYYSDMVSIKSLLNVKIDKLFPNPVENNLTTIVSMPDAEAATAEIMDVTGKVVMNQEFQLQPGANSITMSTEQLPKGYYLFRVRTADASSPVQQLLK